jgi:hypothetical protein
VGASRHHRGSRRDSRAGRRRRRADLALTRRRPSRDPRRASPRASGHGSIRLGCVVRRGRCLSAYLGIGPPAPSARTVATDAKRAVAANTRDARRARAR